jgi:hypothetical protein
MDLIPSKLPERRLITSIVADPPPLDSVESDTDSPFALKGASVFSGNGRAIFIGLLVGAVLISAVGFGYVRHERATRDSAAVPRLVSVATQRLAAPPHSSATPAPLVVQVDASMVRVTAIALGHPRLAVINGRSVAEGDSITVHTSGRAVAVTLRVLRIADGRIDLTDGTQIISARLMLATPTPPDRH